MARSFGGVLMTVFSRLRVADREVQIDGAVATQRFTSGHKVTDDPSLSGSADPSRAAAHSRKAFAVRPLLITIRRRRARISALALLLSFFALSGGDPNATHAARPQPTASSRTDYAPAIGMLTRLIEREMAEKELPAVSIALVDDQQIVWSKGFGLANPNDRTPVTAETVYRVGSVSKLFTDIAVMQLVERGTFDLDEPVTRYVPDFHPRNPFARSITLRQLMSHRSGLAREPPVGNYFDPTEPSLAETVASLNETALVYPPETRTKYSNAAIATVGYALERVAQQPFAKYLKHALLDPLGMQQSAFEPAPEINRNLARAFMWTLDGRIFEAPTFQIGMAPAGSMYTTVNDLGRFMSALFAGGRGLNGSILKAATLEQMWTPQHAEDGRKTGYGIGFAISTMNGHRTIGHGGAIYGFATQLSALPDDKLGAVVVTTKDAANAVTNRIAEVALQAMLAVRQGERVPQPEITSPVDPALAGRVAGQYVKDDKGVELFESGGKLWLLDAGGGFPAEIRSSGDTLVVDGALAHGPRLVALGDQVVLDNETFVRSAAPKPQPPPTEWQGLIGEYGWDHDVLYILEKGGRLWALIEWFEFDPLEKASDDVFRFPDHGLYAGEQLVFTRDARGRATQVIAANVTFQRRVVGPEDGAPQLRITPVRPVSELLAESRASRPPTETRKFQKAELVELTRLDSTIHLDIRYASTNNFLGTVLYPEPRAFLQRPAAEALVRAHRKLKASGYGLLVHDGYRPWYVTKVFWDATPEDKKVFVADPAQGSRHNRGAAVDLTLYDLRTGKPVEMVSTYDETTDRAYADYPGGTSLQRWHRQLLRDTMNSEGFSVYQAEWWHFDYKDWQKYAVANMPFDKLK
jgi:CubicO group peptidase (beta-lactamase class C family)/D-alanyl-D-alanine dipeptidase